MSSAYTPGLSISRAAAITRRRELPLPGQILVKVGDLVEAEQSVLSAETPGELVIVRVAEEFATAPTEIAQFVTVSVGSFVKQGEIIAQRTGLFGLYSDLIKAPISGTIEYISTANGHVGVRGPADRVTVSAYISGRVCQIENDSAVEIEAHCALLQGVFGIGGERTGEILALKDSASTVLTAKALAQSSASLAGKIIVGGASFDCGAIEFARDAGARGIITGSADIQTLEKAFNLKISAAVTGNEDTSLSFMVTEGFGQLNLAQRVLNLALEFNGQPASINGTTQVRAGAVRPELLIATQAPNANQRIQTISTALDLGSKIRSIRAPYFGLVGTVTDLPADPLRIETGAEVRVAHVLFQGRANPVVIPRANLELVD
ncbi:hypothetical protein JNK13_02390 [bacterium]|nr:hypothetical protein [bacterium]